MSADTQSMYSTFNSLHPTYAPTKAPKSCIGGLVVPLEITSNHDLAKRFTNLRLVDGPIICSDCNREVQIGLQSKRVKYCNDCFASRRTRMDALFRRRLDFSIVEMETE